MLDRCKEGIQAINFEVPFLGCFASRGLFLCVCVCVCVSVVNTVCGGLKLTCFSCLIKSLFLRGTFYNEATSKSCRDKSNTSVHNALDFRCFFKSFCLNWLNFVCAYAWQWGYQWPQQLQRETVEARSWSRGSWSGVVSIFQLVPNDMCGNSEKLIYDERLWPVES